MTLCVLDASVAVAWGFETERTIETDAIYDRVQTDGALVPHLWFTEVANAFLAAERRGRITGDEVHAEMADLWLLPLAIDDESIVHFWSETLALARAHRLTVYDATYLGLAVRSALPLATLDRALADAARHAGVVLLLD